MKSWDFQDQKKFFWLTFFKVDVNFCTNGKISQIKMIELHFPVNYWFVKSTSNLQKISCFCLWKFCAKVGRKMLMKLTPGWSSRRWRRRCPTRLSDLQKNHCDLQGAKSVKNMIRASFLNGWNLEPYLKELWLNK